MRTLKTITVGESNDLIKGWSNQTLTPKEIVEIIDNAKRFEKGKSLDKLKEIIENYKKKVHPTKPSKLSEKIRSTGETAYQRAIFLSGKTRLHSLGEIVWNDLELPVLFSKSSRRRCVDLIGTINDSTPVLCELKFASKTNNSNSPVYAAIELLIYYYLITDNCDELDNRKVFHQNERVKHFEWSSYNLNSIFIIGANKRYWEYWQRRYEKVSNKIESWHSSLPLKIRFFCSADFDFEKQKGSKALYQPSVSDKTEWMEVSLY